MNCLWNNKIIKNQYGQVRSGWILLLAIIALYIIQFILSTLLINLVQMILTATGAINPAADSLSPLLSWINNNVLPVIFQIMYNIVMILVPLITWKVLMRYPLRDLGLSLRSAGKDGCIGLLLGICSCTVILLILLAIGNVQITSLGSSPPGQILSYSLAFIFMAAGEELMYRGFFMSVLRRCRNLYFLMFVPSIIFGIIHLNNPGTTLISFLNIILVGLLFSYMYIKSGSIWINIGFHFTWNLFQGVLYGLPVSGLHSPSLMTVQFTQNNILNGGDFGIEGGVLTTIVTLLTFLFVWYYYRNSKYDFLSGTTTDAST